MKDGPRSSKFYRKSRTLLAMILGLVGDGVTQAEIARSLGILKSSVSYHLKRAEDEGYVQLEVRDAIKIITLTKRGRKFLVTYESDEGTPLLRLEHIIFKAPILQLTDRLVGPDWRRVQMKNWVQYQSRVDKMFVKINIGKLKTIEFYPSAIDGKDPCSLLVDMMYECQLVARKLGDLMGLQIGRLEVSSRPEWVVYDAVAREYCKFNGQVTVHQMAKINASAPRSLGEIEFFSPIDAVDYLKMPRKVHGLAERVSRMESEGLSERIGGWHFRHTANN